MLQVRAWRKWRSSRSDGRSGPSCRGCSAQRSLPPDLPLSKKLAPVTPLRWSSASVRWVRRRRCLEVTQPRRRPSSTYRRSARERCRDCAGRVRAARWNVGAWTASLRGTSLMPVTSAAKPAWFFPLPWSTVSCECSRQGVFCCCWKFRSAQLYHISGDTRTLVVGRTQSSFGDRTFAAAAPPWQLTKFKYYLSTI